MNNGQTVFVPPVGVHPRLTLYQQLPLYYLSFPSGKGPLLMFGSVLLLSGLLLLACGPSVEDLVEQLDSQQRGTRQGQARAPPDS